MLKRYPNSLRWRQAIPPLFVLSLVFGGSLALFWQPARYLLASVVSIYVFILLLAGVQIAFEKKDITLLPIIPLAIAVMHLSWGTAFLWSMIKSPDPNRVSG